MLNVERLRKLNKCEDCLSKVKSCNQVYRHEGISGKGSETPIAILLFEAPSILEDNSEYGLSYSIESILKDALKDHFKDVYITFATKCSITTQDGEINAPSAEILDFCNRGLLVELSKFSENTVIMPMGNLALKALIPNHRGILVEAGKVRELDINGKNFKILPTTNPYSINYNENMKKMFFNSFTKLLKGNLSVDIEDDDKKVVMLEPDTALKFLDETKQRFLDKEIEYVVYDSETLGLLPWQHDIIMLGFAHTADKRGFSIPLVIQNTFFHADWPYPLYPINLGIKERDILLIKKHCRELFRTVPIVAHNGKFDAKMACYHNFMELDNFRLFNDTMFLVAVLVGRQWPGDSIGLKESAMKLFHLESSWGWLLDEWLKKFRLIEDRHFGNVPTCILQKYCALDVYYTRELHELLFPLIQEHDCSYILSKLNSATEMYTEAELKGISIDWNMHALIKEKSDEFVDVLSKNLKEDSKIKQMMDNRLQEDLNLVRTIRKEKEEGIGTKRKPKSDEFFITKYNNGEYFNPASSADKRSVLYDMYRVPVYGVTKKGEPSTDKDTIKEIITKQYDKQDLVDLCEKFLEFNKFNKLKSTYVDSLENQIDSEFKMVHPEFNIAGTTTGRLSSGFHTLPKKCLHGDTSIKLLSGESKKIKDLVGLESFWVYSYDIKTNTLVPALGKFARKTDTNRELIRVHLDNNSFFDCTPDHLVLLSNNKYKKAGELTCFDSIKALYTRINEKGYEEFSLKDNDWKKTHRHIYEWKYGCKSFGTKSFAHHRNFNKLDNTPNNLCACSKSGYIKYHGVHTVKKNKLLIEKGEHPFQSKELHDRLTQEGKRNHSSWGVLYSKGLHPMQKDINKKMLSDRMVEKVKNNNHVFQFDENKKLISELTKEKNRINNPMKNEETRKKKSITEQKRVLSGEHYFVHDNPLKKPGIASGVWLKSRMNNAINVALKIIHLGLNLNEDNYMKNKNRNSLSWATLPKYFHSHDEFSSLVFSKLNHKIIKIEFINSADVYDITVEKYNNFLLDCGIFVHNSEIKRMYTSRWAENGGLWTAPDASQLELRVTASLSGEPNWITAFTEGRDLHQQTASDMLGIPFDEVTKDQRGLGKTFNFSILYGVSPESIAKTLNISVEEAKEYLRKYYETIPYVQALKEKQEKFAKKNGYIWNMFKRYMPIPDAMSDNKRNMGHGLRQAFNYLIQSTSSDIITSTIIDLYKEEIKKRKMKSLILSTVHDSIEVDIYPGEAITLFNLFKYYFEDRTKELYDWLICPMIISLDLGTSWGSAIEFEHIYELTERSITYEATSLRKNFLMLKNTASKAYNIDFEILNKKEIPLSKISSEQFIKDKEEWKVKVTLSTK